MSQSTNVPVETPPADKKPKVNRFFTWVGSVLTVLFGIWMIFAFNKGTTIFDLAACFSSGEPDAVGCAGKWVGRSVGITVVQPLGAVPVYSRATPLDVPAKVLASLGQIFQNGKNLKVVAYKTTDDTNKVKGFLIENFKKNGWLDESSNINIEDKQKIEQLNGFLLAFSYGQRAALVYGIPSPYASNTYFDNVSEQDNAFIIVTEDSA